MTFSTIGGSRSSTAPRPETGDHRDPPGHVAGVEPLDQRRGVLRAGGRAELEPDRVGQLGDQVDVRAVELAGPVADPHHVGRQVVRAPADVVDPGQRALVLEQQRLVAGEQVDAVRGVLGVEVDTAGTHERERPVDLGRQRLVPAPGRAALDEVGVPRVRLAQVGQSAARVAADQVQRQRRRVVGAEHAVRIGLAAGHRAGQVVDRVAAVRRQLDDRVVDGTVS